MLRIDQLREKYGLSIAELAQYLGISKSLAAKAEKMERSLPVGAGLRLLAMQLAAQQHAESEFQSGYKENQLRQQLNIYNDHISDLKHRSQKCQLQAIKLKKKSAKLAAAYPVAENFLKLTAHLSPQLTGTSLATKKQQVWVAEMNDLSREKIKRCDPAAQLELKKSIEMLYAEQQVLANMIQELNDKLLQLTPVADEVKTLADQNSSILPIAENKRK